MSKRNPTGNVNNNKNQISIVIKNELPRVKSRSRPKEKQEDIETPSSEETSSQTSSRFINPSSGQIRYVDTNDKIRPTKNFSTVPGTTGSEGFNVHGENRQEDNVLSNANDPLDVIVKTDNQLNEVERKLDKLQRMTPNTKPSTFPLSLTPIQLEAEEFYSPRTAFTVYNGPTRETTDDSEVSVSSLPIKMISRTNSNVKIAKSKKQQQEEYNHLKSVYRETFKKDPNKGMHTKTMISEIEAELAKRKANQEDKGQSRITDHFAQEAIEVPVTVSVGGRKEEETFDD